LADPSKYPNLFPDLNLVRNIALHCTPKLFLMYCQGLQAEQWTQKNKFADLPAVKYLEMAGFLSKDLVGELKAHEQRPNGASQ